MTTNYFLFSASSVNVGQGHQIIEVSVVELEDTIEIE